MLLATIVVTGTGDTIADDGIVTLREAITAANTNAASGDAAAGDTGLDTIDFDIPGTGVQTIASATDLPAITEPIAIDGHSQPGTHANTSGPGLGDNAVLRIQIVPTQLRAGSRGLLVSGGGSSVRGLVINEFTYGIDLRSSGGNTIAGDYIGTTPDGLSRVANGMEDGIFLQSSNNTIGGTAPADRNVLNAQGSAIHVPINPVGEASNNVIKGNFIGTDAPGTNGVGADEGIEIESGSGDQIGGGEPGAGNLISSVGKAIFVDLGGPDPGNTRNGNGGHVIQGNLIGTDVTGTFLLPSNAFSSEASVGNEQDGILVTGGIGPEPVDPQPIVIGGTSPGEGNVIAGSQSTPGISFLFPVGFNAPSSIEGNFIGTDRTGVKDLGNRAGGIDLYTGTTNVTVTHNTIAYNGTAAVNVPAGETAILVVDNSIYDNAGGVPGIVRQLGASPPIPTLASITVAGPTATVSGTVQGAAGSTVRVDLYANAPPPQGIFVQGQTLVQTIQVPIGPDGNGSFTATFPTVLSQPLITATATSPSNTTSPFSEPATLPAGASADLSVTVADSPDPVAPDGTITYDLSVSNEGPDAALGVSLVDDIPAGTTFVTFTAPAGWTASTPAAGGTGSASATADALSNGAGAAFTLVVRAGPGAVDGSTIVDSASVSASPSTDNAPNNNTGGTTTTVAATSLPPVTADLEVTQSASPATATVGRDAATFRITVTDLGPASASNAMLTETLPAGVTFLSATGGVTPSDGKLTFPLGDMATGASLTFTILVRPRSSGTLTASATASATEADPSTANNTATASSSAVDPTIVPTPTPTPTPTAGIDGPHIVGVQRFGIHTMPTTVVLTFDAPLGAIAARDVKNYRITDTNGARIAVRSAVYDAAAHTVTLRTAQRISIHRPYKLVIRGTGPDGLSDGASHLIDGQRTGQPGSDYATTLTWRNLVLPAWYRSARTSATRGH